MKFTITVVGTKRILGNFKKIEFNLPYQSDLMTEEIAVNIRDRARLRLAMAPYKNRRNGALEEGTNAYRSKSDKNNKQWVVLSQAFDDFGEDYAPYVEYGTASHEIPNNPMWGLVGKTHPGAHSTGPKITYHYFTDSVNQTKQELQPISTKHVNRAIKRSGFK
jgi:hypothetical protein